MLRAMYDVTSDKIWLERYRKALSERPVKSDKTRIQICSEGYSPDREVTKGFEDWGLWCYVGVQGSLAQLIKMETDKSLVSQYQQGLDVNVKNSLVSIEAYKMFDNNDTKVFGHARWREGYTVWFPQATQADAKKLADESGDKTKLGNRKSYECFYMRNPLAAAAIIALAGDGRGREAIERAICHYDYSKINMSEFFFAECAYYALPFKK
jgi:hypothetical protein